MNRILCTILTCSFAVGFTHVCFSRVMWAYEKDYGMKNERSRESTGHIAQIKAEEKGKKAEVAEDPVCGMEVRTTEKALSEEYQGKTYYFCSEYCHKAFKKTPQAYTTPSKIPGYGKERDTYY